MEKRWQLLEKAPEKIIEELATQLSINPILLELLYQRGITDFDSAKAFFRPSLTDLHSPFLMQDMDKAIDRIIWAIQENQPIMVYGDYDVDGTTSVALVYSFLKSIHPLISYYIPDRYKEGYGISFQGIDVAKEQGASLIIALDCGIKAIDKVAYATQQGIDFIICDHHRPGDSLPNAVAVLDPKRDDCAYPYKELSGCGIGFKLIQALAEKKAIPFEALLPYLDLVTLSIASDIVPITGENRILAFYGLERINKYPRLGIETILQYAKFTRKSTSPDTLYNRYLTITDMVFLVGPRINAAGRMESGNKAVELLICEDISAIEAIATAINKNNTDRKDLDASITLEALQEISENPLLKEAKSTVLKNKDWHKGVLGIVASRLTETYYRPTIVFTEADGLLTGSARSVKGFDIYNAIEACKEFLDHFGGHMYAAGLSIKPTHFEAFKTKFEAVVSATITQEMLTPVIEIDSLLRLEDITPNFYNILRQFAPFGPGNMAPVFQTKGVVDNGQSRIVGKDHLKLGLMSASGYQIEGIAFQQAPLFSKISSGKPFSICYHIEENEWNGKKSLQLRVLDLRFEA